MLPFKIFVPSFESLETYSIARLGSVLRVRVARVVVILFSVHRVIDSSSCNKYNI